MLIEGKVAIITGASAGIGLATARLFIENGAKIVLNARDGSKLKQAAVKIDPTGTKTACVAGDASLAATHEQLVTVALERFGRLDIGFNNAGAVGEMAPLAEQREENWRAVLGVNLASAFHGAKVQIPAMIENGGGALVFTSSFVGSSAGIPGMAVYGTAKAGLMGLVRGIAADYSEQGIRAAALMSGGVDTAMAGDDEQKQWAASLHAMKRIADPEEIARAALFLASPMASFVTGSALWADGGNSAVKL